MASLKATASEAKAPGTIAVAAAASEEEEIDDEEPSMDQDPTTDQDGAPPPPISSDASANKKSVTEKSKDKPELPAKDATTPAEASGKKETVRQSASIGLGLDISVTVVQKKKELPTGLATDANLICLLFCNIVVDLHGGQLFLVIISSNSLFSI